MASLMDSHSSSPEELRSPVAPPEARDTQVQFIDTEREGFLGMLPGFLFIYVYDGFSVNGTYHSLFPEKSLTFDAPLIPSSSQTW